MNKKTTSSTSLHSRVEIMMSRKLKLIIEWINKEIILEKIMDSENDSESGTQINATLNWILEYDVELW